MPIVTIVTALLLIAVGVGSRLLSDSGSITVMIPAFIGVAMLFAGLLACKPGLRKHAMHAAAMIALLAILGSAGALAQLPALLSGQDVERPLAVAARSATFLIATAFLGLCIRSFIRARVARQAEGG